MKAYITLLSNKDYLPGVIALSRSLLAVDAKYPLYCVLSCSVDVQIEQHLIEERIKCLRLSRTAWNENANSVEGGFGHWNLTFDKLLIWELTQFDKLVFLDSDMMVVRNIDSLFECKSFSAVSADCSFPGNEGWAGGLNSGLMVIEPDVEVAEKLCTLIPTVVARFQSLGASVGDQDVIKEYCTWWASDKSLHLDEGYNIFADHLGYYIKKIGYSLEEGMHPIYVVHFVGRKKPWMVKTWKEYLYLLKNCIVNPDYISIYRQYIGYIKQNDK